MKDKWILLHKNNCVELWKTPVKYLTCIKIEGIFKFFDNKEEAYNEFKKLVNI